MCVCVYLDAFGVVGVTKNRIQERERKVHVHNARILCFVEYRDFISAHITCTCTCTWTCTV